MSKLESSPEAPLPLRRVSLAVSEWVSRLGEIWVEGQVAQISRRPGVQTCFLTLRDVDANISMQVTCSRMVLPDSVTDGARIVLRARPDFYTERGTLSLRATDIRQVGLGELLARLERLKQLLAAEGLFAAERKKPLPLLPRTIGLITGRASAAEHDVVSNTRRRLPSAQFAIETVATQGSTAVSEIIDALARLDARADVEVIVIARGGGSIEDLLPFSNEGLIRAVAATRTPVVSAIGHETDQPLLDFAADYAASTPTDAAKHIVADLTAELSQLAESRRRLRSAIHRRLAIESELMDGLPGRLRRSVLAMLEQAQHDATTSVDRIRRRLSSGLDLAEAEAAQLLARVVSLSPQAVLNRGYAVLQTDDGSLVRDAGRTSSGQRLTARVATGEFIVEVT